MRKAQGVRRKASRSMVKVRREAPVGDHLGAANRTAVRSRLRRVCPLQQIQVGAICTNLGGTASVFVPWDEGEFYFGGEQHV